MKNLNAIDWVVLLLVVVGGINWGLVGLLDVNVVEAVFGEAAAVARAIYVLVGLSALYMLYTAMQTERES